jgi:hypothetical protein
MDNRDRATGWKHAKISGHFNENSVTELISNDTNTHARILSCSKCQNLAYSAAILGGINEKKVESVVGAKTTPKTDIEVQFISKSINVSLKKSLGGQVFLVSVDNFIKGFEVQYNKKIPDKVKKAISLFWGTSDEVKYIVNHSNSKYKKYELRKHRVVASTLEKYDKELSDLLILWFAENMADIFDFCFSKGLAKNQKDWADILWYKNQLEENDIDEMFSISEIRSLIPNEAEYGPKNGGTTIQLPFGFVQWHCPSGVVPGLMQFHHSFKKLKKLV